jgi:protein-disulfide isomerase
VISPNATSPPSRSQIQKRAPSLAARLSSCAFREPFARFPHSLRIASLLPPGTDVIFELTLYRRILMKTRDIVAQCMSALAVASAVIMTSITIRNQLHGPERATATPTTTRVKDWRKYAVAGHRSGADSAPVTIVEFADFQCPVCRSFNQRALAAILTQYSSKVTLVFRHWPLEIHPFAYAAARASECAAAQGRFAPFRDALYRQQDSIGVKRFARFAAEVNVPDIGRFTRCSLSKEPVATIDADIAAARELGARGTPTLLVNGLMLPGATDSAHLAQFVQEALKEARR